MAGWPFIGCIEVGTASKQAILRDLGAQPKLSTKHDKESELHACLALSEHATATCLVARKHGGCKFYQYMLGQNKPELLIAHGENKQANRTCRVASAHA